MEEIQSTIKPLNSLVAIRIKKLVRDEIEFLGGSLALAATSKDEEESLSVTFGEVHATPLSMQDIHNHGVISEMALKVGDKVHFDRFYSCMHTSQAVKANKPTYQFLHETKEGDQIILIPYGAIYMFEREGELYSLNDYIVGEAVEKPKASSIIHSLSDGEIYRDRIKVVCHPPKGVRYKESSMPTPKVEVGQVVVCRDNTIIPIKDNYEKRQLFRIRLRGIIGNL